ncbi:MAG TPA: PLD nuclease N-terminal domain-containing protein [Actinomycetota bacterium]|nr:PLD nuclease N-terminal domain-containing protein [Actinomycetota bacterium]
MIFGGGLFAFALLALWIYCIVDVIATNEGVIRNLPKLVWLLIVIFVPTIGSIVWLFLGRPERAGLAPGDSNFRAEPRGPRLDPSARRALGTMAPDDDPRYLAELDERTKRLRDWEADLRRRENELRDRDEDDG